MTRRTWFLSAAAPALFLILILTPPAQADPPVASYSFPAGGRRGATVAVRVGGLNLHSKASFEILGPGVTAEPEIRRIDRIWFEGPLLPLPDSQQPEDYPGDYAGRISIADDAAIGPRAWRVWTSQGASGSLPFVVGDLPEVVESEVDGEPIPVAIDLPITVNGRIFPREDVDLWSFPLRAGQVVTATVAAGLLGSPLDPWMEALDPAGNRLAESAPGLACDARLAWVAPSDGVYTVKIHDVAAKGGQNYVYRLTLTTGPSVERVYPLGGRRGTEVAFSLTGLGVSDHPEPLAMPADGAGRGPESVVLPLPTGGRTTVELDDLPEALETEPNDDPAHASILTAPGVGNGRIDHPGDVDAWSIPLAKGKTYEFEIRAVRLGSSLDAVQTLSDPGGAVVARSDGSPTRAADPPPLTFRPTADGVHILRVQDRYRSRGGPALAYRLRVSESPAADFRLVLPTDTLGVPRGGPAPWKVDAERLGGFAGPITVEIDGLPDGVTASKTVIAANAGSAEVVFKADATAPIRSARLSVRGVAEIGGMRVEHRATRHGGAIGLPEIDTLRLAVALATPFQIAGRADFGSSPRGSIHGRRYRIERGKFTGPIEVRLADRQARHLQGVTGPVMTVAEGQESFDYAVTLPPWMEIGRTSRAVVMATGVVREPDGTEHEVSVSSPKNEHQVVAVVGPGRLGLDAGRTSLAVVAGGTAEVPVKVSRDPGVKGPVRVELIGTGQALGLSAEPLILNDGHDEGIVRVHFARSVVCPPSARLVLRASVLLENGPATAEARLTLVAASAP